jgi:hypothetical protein
MQFAPKKKTEMKATALTKFSDSTQMMMYVGKPNIQQTDEKHLHHPRGVPENRI